MDSFETDGFLSTEISEYEKKCFDKYSLKFNLAYEVNRQAHKIIYSVNIKNIELVDLLMATLLTRQTSSFQSFLVLSKKGLLAQAEMILRNIAENMFIVGAIGKDKTFSEKYVLAEEITRKKALKRLLDNDERDGKMPDQKTLDLIDELDQKIKNENIVHYSTERIAKIAGLSNYYDTLYPLTSMAVHTSTRGLDKGLQTNNDGTVEAIDYGPAIEDLDMHLDFSISMMLYTLHEIACHFGLHIEKIEELQKQNNALADVT